MTDRTPDIQEILDSYDRSQEALNFTPRSDNDIRAELIAKAVREWNGDLVAALNGLDVTDGELLRIRNNCNLVDPNGMIKIWAVLLQKMVDHIRDLRTLAALKDTK